MVAATRSFAAVCLLACGLVACHRGAPSQSAPFHLENTVANTNAYLLLKDGTIHTGQPPRAELVVMGSKEGDQFRPQGDVQGDGPLGQAGSPGWMELASGTFFGDQTARPPFPPYVKGYRSPQGEFRPAGRTVTY